MADKKKKNMSESYVRAPYESSKSKKSKVASAINNILMLGHVTVPKFEKDPPSLEQATKDGKPTKYEMTWNDLGRAMGFDDAAKEMGVHTKEGAVAHNRSLLIKSTSDVQRGDLSGLINASNLPTVKQMKIAEKMKNEITKPKKKKK